jgi:diguanylate cyclase (GGDEF)-like protein
LQGRIIVFQRLYSKEALPKWLADKLTEMTFTAQSSIISFVIGLVMAAPMFWWRSKDVWIAAAMGTAILLSAYRLAVIYRFKQRNRYQLCTRSNDYWMLLYAIGCWCFSLNLAVLVARTFIVGELVSIALALGLTSAYLIGMIIRASAAPHYGVPHLLLLFVPLIVIASCAPDRGYLLVAVLLVMFCVGCVEIIANFHRSLKAQLIAEHQLSLLARTDHLTGLANRGSLEAHATLLQDNYSNRGGYALALIDLDGFKSVNDTFGHGAGDELLKEVSIRIRAVLGDRHFCARLGGDEFAIIFDPDAKLDDAITVANQIVGSLKRPFEIAGNRPRISGSVGLAKWESPGDSFASIMERADKALYRAKSAGRDQTQVLVVAPDLSPGIVPAPSGAPAGFVFV